MLTKEEWAALTPEEQEERVEEKPEDDPAPTGKPGVEDKPDRPIKNYEAELARKTQKIAELKAKIDEREENERKSEFSDKMGNLGMDEEFTTEVSKEMDRKLDKKIETLEKKWSTLTAQVYSSSKDRFIAEIQAEDDTGWVSKYRDEIDGILAEVQPPEILGDKMAVKRIVDMVIGNHMQDIVKSKKTSPGSPTEDKITGKKVDTGAVNEKELQEEANIMGISLDNPEIKKKVITAVLAKKKALELRNKE